MLQGSYLFKGEEQEAIPSLNKLALKPREFRLAAYLRLGASLQFPSWLGQ